MYFLITTIHNQHTRWARVKAHLEQTLGEGEVYPILAPDRDMFKHTTLNPKQYKQQSLTLAYFQAAQTALFLGLDDYVVLEDDVLISHENELFDLEVFMPENFDLVYLTRTKHNSESAEVLPYDQYFDIVVGNYWETPITAWSIKFAKEFIAHVQSKLKESLWLGHIDHELMKLCETKKYYFYASKQQVALGLSNVEQSEMSKEGSIHLDVIS